MNSLTESEINTLQLCIINMSDGLLPTGIAQMKALHAKLEGMKTPNKVLQSDGGEVMPAHKHLYIDGHCACGSSINRRR
jgi:hypothetical protein